LEAAMVVQVRSNQWTGVVAYFFAITALSLLGTKLSSVVAEKAVVLSLPYLESGPPKRSPIDQRHTDAPLAIPLSPVEAKKRVITLKAPSMPANILAARLDLAETEGSANEKLDFCLASWDTETHITKNNWRKICVRELSDE
jgi:hypothetical protein